MTDEILVDLTDLAAHPRPVAQVGGKAANLGRLIAAGAPVPRGFVVTADAMSRCFEPGGPPACPLDPTSRDPVLAAVSARAAGLKPPLIVRSSASIEDGATAAPGLFESCRGVAPDRLGDALATVWASAHTPLVEAYRDAHGLGSTGLHIAAIVQEQVAGSAAGTLYSHLPGRSGAALIETEIAGEVHSATVTGAPPDLAIEPPDFPLPAATSAEIVGAGRIAAAALATDAVDVEWVWTGSAVVLVQARPLPRAVAGEVDRTPPAELFAFSRAEPDLVWRWDASHNPEPLSPAQAGLVSLVDAAGLAPYRQRVVGGYLYATDPPPPPAAIDADALRDRFEKQLRPRMEAALAPLEDSEPPRLADALRGFTEVYRIYAGELGPMLRAARAALIEVVGPIAEGEVDRWVAELIAPPTRAEPTEPPDAVRAIAAPQSPSWDVAVPTYGERPDVLDRIATEPTGSTPARDSDPADRLRARLPAAHRDRLDRALAAGRLAHELGEIDDWLYARAQAGVRRALLAVAEEWRLSDPSDIFYLPLDWIAEHAGAPPPGDLPARTAAARAVQLEQSGWAMPMAFRDGRPIASRSVTLPEHCFLGQGTGGRVTGTVVEPEDLVQSTPLPADPVLVARAITPSMAFLARDIIAVVSDHGSLLGHGAAMARELGVPCVVGCAGATAHLSRGDRVWVDGQAGLVVRIIPRG